MSDQQTTPPTDENQLIAERREKLKALREAHRNGAGPAFPNDFKPGHQAATLHGARALGLESAIGSLVPGKSADLCAVALDFPELGPCYDPVSHLVYAAGREHVSHVWVAGRARVIEGEVLGIDTRSLNNRILLWHNKLASQLKNQ